MIILFKIIKILFYIIIGLAVIMLALSFRRIPENINYGVSFSKFRADELNLPWKDVLSATLDDLNVKHFRLSAHWPMIEPREDVFDFSSLDYQLDEISKRGGDAVVAIGRRLPSWPECHTPEWVKSKSWVYQKEKLLTAIETTVNRYKDNKTIKYWQVENEPYLSVFAKEQCGELDEEFLKEEINLVKSLDSTRQILVTDSGNLGLWYKAWRLGDVFGTSVYIYLWNPNLGQIKTLYEPFVYRVKTNFMELFFGAKKSLLIELSLEPWLIKSVLDTPIEVQLSRMDQSKFEEVISFAKRTGFEDQYLWGVEWWYFMKEHGHPEFWEGGKKIFNQAN
jgi:hypothetical protein